MQEHRLNNDLLEVTASIYALLGAYKTQIKSAMYLPGVVIDTVLTVPMQSQGPNNLSGLLG